MILVPRLKVSYAFRSARSQSTDNITADTLLVDSKGFHRALHAVETCGLPDEINAEVKRVIGGDVLGFPKFESNFVGNV